MCVICVVWCMRRLVTATGSSYKYYTYARSSERTCSTSSNYIIRASRARDTIDQIQAISPFLCFVPFARLLFSGLSKTRVCVSFFFRRHLPPHLPSSYVPFTTGFLPRTMNGRAKGKIRDGSNDAAPRASSFFVVTIIRDMIISRGSADVSHALFPPFTWCPNDFFMFVRPQHRRRRNWCICGHVYTFSVT